MPTDQVTQSDTTWTAKVIDFPGQAVLRNRAEAEAFAARAAEAFHCVIEVRGPDGQRVWVPAR